MPSQYPYKQCRTSICGYTTLRISETYCPLCRTRLRMITRALGLRLVRRQQHA